jgi:hypothetical protein
MMGVGSGWEDFIPSLLVFFANDIHGKKDDDPIRLMRYDVSLLMLMSVSCQLTSMLLPLCQKFLSYILDNIWLKVLS